MILRTLIVAALLLMPSIALAGKERVSRVKDGDTVELVGHRVFGTATSIRLRGVDTPEHDFQAKCEAERAAGLRALALTTDLIAKSGGLIWIKHISRDKYGGRFVADVRVRISDL
jgi:micrococcal nuclease